LGVIVTRSGGFPQRRRTGRASTRRHVDFRRPRSTKQYMERNAPRRIPGWRRVVGDEERTMQFVVSSVGILRGLAPKLGPYLLLEIFLPGGTLCALLLFLYRRGKTKPGPDTQRTEVAVNSSSSWQRRPALRGGRST
jgi:hypothetical protein